MAKWNSIPLEITFEILGWVSFLSWSACFYPQVILNYRRKSVVGLNFDFVVLNLTKHSSYLIYNVSLYFSPAIQKQYFQRYGFDQMIPVAANDVGCSIHAVLLTRGVQRVSRISLAIVSAVWLSAAFCFFIALPTHSWLWLINIFNSIQVFMTLIKYTPQVVMNFRRKNTNGFSIGYVLFDFSGGSTSYTQMIVQSVDQHSWVNFYGNIGKTLLSLVSLSFGLVFMCQHYLLYLANKASVIAPEPKKEVSEPLLKSSKQPELENV
ncbi:cystinosin homolog isoform X2 [Mangifera indica]|uniref:cystinosin homolog isoform X2 n=1 Tax=Mangifera indica TaxID=29780 RepID=UPI001CFA51BC|nr:cystinosin homolog isoform X2 [Mangifera indica]